MFDSAKKFNTWSAGMPEIDVKVAEAARARQQVLTKPPGSLGRLEELACWMAGWQGQAIPQADKVQLVVFAGNHGVAARGVSAFPPEVTVQMVANFEAGGAAINALCNCFGYDMSVVALELERPTADFTKAAAMSAAECLAALNAGAAAVDGQADIIAFGEMGIGNTTAASALAAAVFGGSGADWAGPGTGHDAAGIKLKGQIIDEALLFHSGNLHTPFEILRRLGGREIAAIAGGIIGARAARIPVVLDGFIASAAACVLTPGNAGALEHCVAGHVSAENAHKNMLARLELEPLLDLGMRLGEGSGAALAVQVIRAALATHSQMATFAEAGVSDKEG